MRCRRPPARSKAGRPPQQPRRSRRSSIARSPAIASSCPPAPTEGDLIIDKPITLAGSGRPSLLGSGTAASSACAPPASPSRASTSTARGGGDLGRDTSGIHVAAPRVTIRDCRIRERAVRHLPARVGRRGGRARRRSPAFPDRPPGEVGSGIHVWNSQRFHADRQPASSARATASTSSRRRTAWCAATARATCATACTTCSPTTTCSRTTSFETGAAGAALMYSKRLTFRRNRFVRNRGFASVGLLLKACDDVVAEDNLIADNARGIFLEGLVPQPRSAATSSPCRTWRSSSTTRAAATCSRATPSSATCRRCRWSGAAPTRGSPATTGPTTASPTSTATASPSGRTGCRTCSITCAATSPPPTCSPRAWRPRALGAAERAFPVLDPVPVVDERPLARMPRLLGRAAGRVATSVTRATSGAAPFCRW